MKHIPTKRCDRLDVHATDGGHDWKEGPFQRHCPGRTTPKLSSRNVRRREERKKKS